MGRTLGWGGEVGRTLVGKWRWGGPWWGSGGGADPGGEVEVGRTLVGKWRWGQV